MSQQPTSSRNQLRHEAASWFVIMRGPDAANHREAFEQWLKQDASHRLAYNSVSETFTLGKLLKRGPSAAPPSGTRPPTQTASLPRHRKKEALIAAVLCGIGVSTLGLSWLAPSTRSIPPLVGLKGIPVGPDLEERYATTVGEVRNFALPDGTKMVLDTDSLILASFTPSESSLRLIKGRARFFTDTAKRVSIVRADTVVIRAEGAIVDVGLTTARHVTVTLIAGHVAVQYAANPEAPTPPFMQMSASSVNTINAGDHLELEAGRPVASTAADPGANSWPQGVEQFNGVSLYRLVNEANRYTAKPIRFGDNGLANLRISGTFHLADTGRLAQKIALLLDLRATDQHDVFRLDPSCAERGAIPCPPRS